MKVKKIRWEKGKGPREKRNKKRVNMGKKVKRDEGCQGAETGEKKRGRKEEKRKVNVEGGKRDWSSYFCINVCVCVSGGVYCISSWSHIINAHSVPGPGVVAGLKAVGRSLGHGCLLIAQMSSQGALTTEQYTQTTVCNTHTHSHTHTEFQSVLCLCL